MAVLPSRLLAVRPGARISFAGAFVVSACFVGAIVSRSSGLLFRPLSIPFRSDPEPSLLTVRLAMV